MNGLDLSLPRQTLQTLRRQVETKRALLRAEAPRVRETAERMRRAKASAPNPAVVDRDVATLEALAAEMVKLGGPASAALDSDPEVLADLERRRAPSVTLIDRARAWGVLVGEARAFTTQGVAQLEAVYGKLKKVLEIME